MNNINTGGADFVPPTLTLSSSVITHNNGTWTLTITASEIVNNLVTGDATLVGCTLGALSTSDGIVYTGTVTPTSNTNCTIFFAAGVCTDNGGNQNLASNTLLIRYQTNVTYGSSTGIIAFGDSITVGVGASDLAHAYISLLGVVFSATVTNHAVSGKGIWVMTSGATDDTILPNNNTKMVTAMAGLNDLRAEGNPTAFANKFKACYKTVVLNAWKKSNVAAGNSGITKTGTWTAYGANAYGGKNGAGGANPAVKCTGAGTLSYTFTDTNVAVSFIGGNGVTLPYGTVNIYIDTVLQTTIDLDVWDTTGLTLSDGGSLPVPIIFTGLSNASHTIKIETNNDGDVIVDYFAIMNAPASVPPVVLFEIPYLNNNGYAGGSPTLNHGTKALSDVLSSYIYGVVDYFIAAGYIDKICFVNTNKQTYFPAVGAYDISTGLSTDNIHPNDTGHAQIKVVGDYFIN